MNMYRKIFMVLVLMLRLSGCTGNDKRELASNSNVENIIQEQISKAEEEVPDTKTDAGNEIVSDTKEVSVSETDEATVSSENNMTQQSDELGNSEGVDIDLTRMDKTMTYATMYNLMIYPNDYIGQTIRLSGEYYAIFYEETNKYYHYVLIKDATECCTQGIEFVWDDGSHVYPDEYPADTTKVEVTGVFETYYEEGDSNLYCRLKDAEFKIK